MLKVNPAAARWLTEWHHFANYATLCLKYKSHDSARIQAKHARTCLQNFLLYYKPQINGKLVLK